ncbi:MAG TPA: hypothetical protein VH743_15915 [Beijerinckiaceae bacterium]|jgi:hypothetical protein
MGSAQFRKPGPVRRTVALVLALALIGAGGWLLHLHLSYGEVVSRKLVVAFSMMIGAGVLLLPTALGR